MNKPYRIVKVGEGESRARQNGLRREGLRIYAILRNFKITALVQFNTGVNNVMATKIIFANGQSAEFYWLSFTSIQRIIDGWSNATVNLCVPSHI